MRFALVIALTLTSVPALGQTEFTLKLAEAVDTNPMRLPEAGSPAGAATRIVAGVDHSGGVGTRGRLTVDGLALGQAFHAFPQYSALGLTAGAGLDGRIARRGMLGVAVDARARLEPARDCDLTPLPTEVVERCSANQDYRSLRAVARGGSEVGPLRVTASAGARHFVYGPLDDLWWYGPFGGASVGWEPIERLQLGVGYERGVRAYLGQRTEVGVGGGVYADPDERRRDTSGDLSASLTMSGRRWSTGVRYAWQRVRSNSTAKSYDRHVLDPSFTAIPAGDLLLRVSARIMRANYDARGPQDASLNVDEEARNRVSVVLEHPLAGDTVFAEAGWAFYAQAFQGAAPEGEEPVDGRFRRHLAHVGLTFRAATERR